MNATLRLHHRLATPYRIIEWFGSKVRQLLHYLSELFQLSGHFFRDWLTMRTDYTDVANQCRQIGLSSMPIATITLLFVGMVFAFQFGMTLRTMGGVNYIGKVVSLAIVRELGPVFTALVVGGRVGAGMAAELGSMRVTEQIDAIRSIGASPYRQLLVPRVLAATLMIPLVSLIAGVVGIVGALMIGWLEFRVSPIAFYNSALTIVGMDDFVSGFTKPFFFGFGTAIIGCFHGFTCKTGTVGVGRATTQAVVNVSLMVVFTDFILTRIFSAIWIF